MPDKYYQHLRGEISREELFREYPGNAHNARHEAWNAELGKIDHTELRSRIKTALEGDERWVLIGGPPCQAYSLVGRSRNKGIDGYSLSNDPKSRLYVEYLQLTADFWPSVS